MTPSAGLLFYCWQDHTVLLAQRSAEMSSPLTWDIAGGQPESIDESPLHTAFREAQEELGCLPENKQLSGMYILPKTTTHQHKYYIYVYLVSLKEKINWSRKIKLSPENNKISWFNSSSLPEKTHFDLSWLSFLLEDIDQKSDKE